MWTSTDQLALIWGATACCVDKLKFLPQFMPQGMLKNARISTP